MKNDELYLNAQLFEVYPTMIGFLFKKIFGKQIISSEKMRNSGNYIYDYAHSFFVEDF